MKSRFTVKQLNTLSISQFGNNVLFTSEKGQSQKGCVFFVFFAQT